MSVTSVEGRRVRGLSPGAMLERLAAALLLFSLFPLLLVISFLIFCLDGFPILYRHQRIGHQGRSFSCLKFRTMCRDADKVLARHLEQCADARREWEDKAKLRFDPRVNRMGSVLRQCSLDEVPQLWNIVRGEMAFVGPRPISASEIRFYGHHFSDYCSVRPGLTGLWQVSGRSDISYEERVKLDVQYVRCRSLALDARLLLKTIPAVLLRRGSC